MYTIVVDYSTLAYTTSRWRLRLPCTGDRTALGVWLMSPIGEGNLHAFLWCLVRSMLPQPTVTAGQTTRAFSALRCNAFRCNRRLCRPRQVSIALAGFTFLYGCHLYFTAQINPQAIATGRHPRPHLHRDWAHPTHICLAIGLTPPTSAPGLGSSRPHLPCDWAHPAHICAGTGLTPPTSALRLGSPRPHLPCDWAHPAHICLAIGLTPLLPVLNKRIQPPADGSLSRPLAHNPRTALYSACEGCGVASHAAARLHETPRRTRCCARSNGEWSGAARHRAPSEGLAEGCAALRCAALQVQLFTWRSAIVEQPLMSFERASVTAHAHARMRARVRAGRA
jgi:hypothetical protein